MKVTVGLILSQGFNIPRPFVTAWTDFLHCLFTGEGNERWPVKITSTRVIESHAFPTDVARNEICRKFLDSDNGNYLLFLDADMVMPPDIAHRLVRHQLPIVTARYDLKQAPFKTVAMKKTGDGPRDYDSVSKVYDTQAGMMAIDAAGAGALLIRRDVLESVRAKHGDNWFQYQIGDKGLRDVSEDMWFFERAKELGHQAWLDADVYSGHIAQFVLDPSWQTNAYRSLRALAAERGIDVNQLQVGA